MPGFCICTHPRTAAKLRLAVCLLFAALFVWAAPARAATIAVNSGDDNTSAGDGACTLREAISNASGDSDTSGGDCAAGEAGSDTIEVSASVGTITLASFIDVTLSPMTIAGNGVTIDGTSLTGSSGLMVVHSNANLSLSNVTLAGGGNSGQGPIHAAGNISLSNVTIRDFARTAITTPISGSTTMALTNVLIEDAVGSYNSHLQSGTVFDVANYSTVTVNNVVLRRLFGGNAAFNIRPNADPQSSITLTGCLSAEAVYPQLSNGNVINNTSGDCVGAIGNGGSAARQIPAPRASACGLPLEGVLVQSATYNLASDCQMTGTIYIPKDLTVTINGNGHTIHSAGGARILQSAGTLTVNNVTFSGSGSSGPALLILQSTSIFRHVAFRGNEGPLLMASQTVEFDRVIFESNSTTSTSGSAASALRHLLSGTATIRNSIVRNNSGGVAAIYAGVSSVHGETPSLTLADSVVFEGNTPRDFANEANAITDARVIGAVLPADVGPFTPQLASRSLAATSKAEPRIPTCRALAPEILVTDLTGHTECQRVGAAGVGKAEIVAAGIVDAVDIWSWVGNGTEACFSAHGAAMVFLDANHSPRTVKSIPAFDRQGYSCARIPRHGTVVLLDALPAGLSQQSPTYANAQTLRDCQVRLLAPLNLRDGPQGAVQRVLPARARLTALERSMNWILVDYHGERGWVSADFVATTGDCG